MNTLDDYLAAVDKLAQLQKAQATKNKLHQQILEIVKFIDPAVYAIESVHRVEGTNPLYKGYAILAKAQVSYNVRQSRTFILSEGDIERIQRVMNDLEWLRTDLKGEDVK